MKFHARLKAMLTRRRHTRPVTRQRVPVVEQLEDRRVFALPLSMTSADADLILGRAPLLSSVQSWATDALQISPAGDVDARYFSPQSSGEHIISTKGINVDMELAIYDAATGVRLAYEDDYSQFNDAGQFAINLVRHVRYIVAVADETGSATGDYTLTILAPALPAFRQLIPNGYGYDADTANLSAPGDIKYFKLFSPRQSTGQLSVYSTRAEYTPNVALFDTEDNLLISRVGGIGFTIFDLPLGKEFVLVIYSKNYATAGQLDFAIDFADMAATVTNTLDSGAGSLRQAIIEANETPNAGSVPDQIRFDIFGTAPFVIRVTTALPTITEAVVIDGSTQSGTGTTPQVAIAGQSLTSTVNGLTIRAAGTTIKKLNIRGFTGDGIDVQADNVILTDNTIGTDWSGRVAMQNFYNGIRIRNSSNVLVLRNVISGNSQHGVLIEGDTADRNQLSSNWIGVTRAGTAALPNGANGVLISDGDENTLTKNIISGNLLNGVRIISGAVQNVLTGNKIGINTTGTAAIANLGDGVLVETPRNKIGGNLPSLRNIISGNGKSGISLSGIGASNNVVEGNYIGTASSGREPLPNQGDGIRVYNAAGNRIGSSSDAAAGNVISGNRGSGVAFSLGRTTGSQVLGNLIGTTADGLSALGNAGSGVMLFSNANNVRIGGTNAISRNVISANGASGITLSGSAYNNKISRNQIGVSLTGLNLSNARSGINLQGRNNTIGGASHLVNYISGNAIGIIISGSAATGNTVAYNQIGSALTPNSDRGIQIASGASANTIGPGNSIRSNTTGISIDSSSIENRITQNSISQNSALGIDLLPSAGATPNDAGDADVGGNHLQNSPILVSAPLIRGADLEIRFQLSSSTNYATYPLTIEFFLSDGFGQGSVYLASAIYTRDNYYSGIQTILLPGLGSRVTAGRSRIVATATDLRGNTSEFSLPRTVLGA